MSSRLRVLVVEERAIMASAFALLLRQWGHEVRIAYHSRTVLQIARGYLPDAVLLDLELMDADAQDMARQLRDLPGFGQVLLIGFSNSALFEGRPSLPDDLFAHHLANPFDPSALQELLRRWEWRTRPPLTPATELGPGTLEANTFSPAAFFSA